MRSIVKALTYHQRQLALSVKAPPISGPTTDAIAYAEPMRPVKAGRCFSATATPMMM